MPLYVITAGSYYDQPRVDRPEGFWAHHVYCVEEGSGVFETPDGRVTLDAGAVLFIRKGYPTSYYPAGNTFKGGFLTFDGEAVDHMLEYWRAEDFCYFRSDALVSMIGHVARLGARNGTPAQLSCALYELLARFFAERNGNRTTPSFMRAKNYIEQHCCEPELSVSEVAREAGISPSLLFRLFREEEHTTPTDFLRRTRIRCAKQILLQRGSVTSRCDADFPTPPIFARCSSR